MIRKDLLKTAKPIIFSTPMVKAILEYRKTVTRIPIKLDLGLADTDKNDNGYLKIPDEYGDYHDAKDLCRYQVGDVIYVRETWQEGYKGNLNKERKPLLEYLYRASGDDISVEFSNGKWRPSIHMPKEAARIFLKVTDVRVERLQDITGHEVEEEGLLFVNNPFIYQDPDTFNKLAHDEYSKMWDSRLSKKDLLAYGWRINPYVWVIDFERMNEVEN